MKSFVIAVTVAAACATAALAQSPNLNRQLAAMEMTVYNKTYCGDTPIDRIERLEHQSTSAEDPKKHTLQERIDTLLAKIQPSKEALDAPDPCAGGKKARRIHFGGGSAKDQTEGAWKQRSYPFIEWQGKPIEQLKDGIAQLKTDFDPSSKDRMKYILTVKLPEGSYPLFYTVTFLDEHDFKLASIVIHGPFVPIEGADGSKLWQAKEQAKFLEKDYKRARDYSVLATF